VKRADAALMGVAIGAAVAVIAYAALRAGERALFLEPNPAMLIWAERSAFFWRSAIALYLGGAGAFGGYAAARRCEDGATRLLRALVALGVVAIVAQGALTP
jgi:hypothetical protein